MLLRPSRFAEHSAGTSRAERARASRGGSAGRHACAGTGRVANLSDRYAVDVQRIRECGAGVNCGSHSRDPRIGGEPATTVSRRREAVFASATPSFFRRIAPPQRKAWSFGALFRNLSPSPAPRIRRECRLAALTASNPAYSRGDDSPAFSRRSAPNQLSPSLTSAICAW